MLVMPSTRALNVFVTAAFVGGSLFTNLLYWAVCPSLWDPSPAQEAPTIIQVQAQECAPVRVVCECPAYEQGWDDAEFARGETIESCLPERLEQACADLLEYDNEELVEFTEPDC